MNFPYDLICFKPSAGHIFLGNFPQSPMQIKPGEKRRSDPGDRIGQHQHRKSRIEPVKRKDPDQSQDADTENHKQSH